MRHAPSTHQGEFGPPPIPKYVYAVGALAIAFTGYMERWHDAFDSTGQSPATTINAPHFTGEEYHGPIRHIVQPHEKLADIVSLYRLTDKASFDMNKHIINLTAVNDERHQLDLHAYDELIILNADLATE